MHDQVYSKELLISNKENGYHDIHAQVDLSTFRRLPYENDCALFLVTFLDPDTKESIAPCPRGMLTRVLDRIGGEGREGWTGLAGVEFEYFQVRFLCLSLNRLAGPVAHNVLRFGMVQFRETPETLEQKKGVNLTALTPGSAFCHPLLSLCARRSTSDSLSTSDLTVHGYSMLRPLLNNDYFHDLHDKAEAFDIEVEGHHTETGPGVFEVRLPPLIPLWPTGKVC